MKLIKRKWRTILAAVAALAALVLPFVLFSSPTATLRSGGFEYSLDIAASEAEQAKGLGGRKSLRQDKGMIFVFSKPDTQCFWMKDMQFPIDIIWLDSDKRVTHVEQNVTPETYPEQFCGDKTTKYVIELNAGEAKRAGIELGNILKL